MDESRRARGRCRPAAWRRGDACCPAHHARSVGVTSGERDIQEGSVQRQGVGDFKYYVGISSLTQVATREDRVCVLNILGGESSDVTPVGHAYSGGNVVFGTSPGRRGQVLETALGDVPVYNNVREGLEAGHSFNCEIGRAHV